MDQTGRFVKAIRVSVLALFVLAIVGAGAPLAAETLYGVDSQNRLVKVDTLTAATTVVGSFGGTFQLTCFGGACFAGLDFKLSDGKLYVSESSAGPNGRIWTLDLATGAATFVTDVTVADGPGNAITQNMAFSPLGVLYGSEHFYLYTIDLSTGAGHFVGTDFSHDDDALAFGPDGTLYGVDGFSAFYRIDPTTGLKTTISGTPCWVSLTFANDGNLYCTDGPAGNLYRINPADGAPTFVGNTGVDIAGLATPPPAPPPCTDADHDNICDTPPPTSTDQCKNDGWKGFNNPSFRNQGQCVSSVVSRRGGR